MMKPTRIAILTLCFFLCIPMALVAQDAAARADELYKADQHRAGYDFLKNAVSGASASDLAGLYWRLARVTLEVGDLEEQEGAPTRDILERYLEGESYADKSIELDPRNHEAYYWKSANIGRWGETKGILNSLFKAKPMKDLLHTALSYNPGHAASFYVLGIMYEKVPGRPISFGNVSYAVSLARKSIDANHEEIAAGIEDEVKLSHYMELARHLWARNWRESKRDNERSDMAGKYRSESDVLEKNFYYEGVVDIPAMSDREEAVEVMSWVIAQFEARGELNNSQMTDLQEAREDLAGWTK